MRVLEDVEHEAVEVHGGVAEQEAPRVRVRVRIRVRVRVRVRVRARVRFRVRARARARVRVRRAGGAWRAACRRDHVEGAEQHEGAAEEVAEDERAPASGYGKG